MEVSVLGIKSELQLLAYTTATATLDPSHVCNLYQAISATYNAAFGNAGSLTRWGQGLNPHPHRDNVGFLTH